MSPDEKAHVARISGRVVGMFQRYAMRIDPESEPFLAFIQKYLEDSNMKSPNSVGYAELYKHIKHGIQAYLKRLDSEGKAGEGEEESS